LSSDNDEYRVVTCSDETHELNKKKKVIFNNLDKSIIFNSDVLTKVDSIQQSLSVNRAIIEEDLKKRKVMRDIYGNEDIHFRNYNPVLEGSVDMMVRLSESDAEYSTYLMNKSERIKIDTDGFSRAVNVSGGTYALSMASATIPIVYGMENRCKVEKDLEAILRPSARDRQEELSSKLEKINPRLSAKLNGAWQTVSYRANVDRHLQAASSMRELISDLLHELAPDNEIMAMEWFKPETENGEPSHKQRARYAIVGRNRALGEVELEPILKLAKDIRDSYEEFNPIAHRRDYEYNLQAHTESLMDSCQIYLLKLLELREKYFESI